MINFSFLKKHIKLAILSLVIIFIIACAFIIFLLLWHKDTKTVNINFTASSTPTPEFLSAEEKDKFGLPADVRAQSLSKDADGNILVYKIIYSDADIIADPSAVAPISPRLEVGR